MEVQSLLRSLLELISQLLTPRVHFLFPLALGGVCGYSRDVKVHHFCKYLTIMSLKIRSYIMTNSCRKLKD